MWMEERGTPINEERVREAVETGAETLAVACPFCTVMLDDGVRSMGKQLRVVDVATLLVESIDDLIVRDQTGRDQSGGSRWKVRFAEDENGWTGGKCLLKAFEHRSGRVRKPAEHVAPVLVRRPDFWRSPRRETATSTLLPRRNAHVPGPAATGS